ncbi:MAG: hypothetical protein IPH16_19830 [Haliscomenobacter sp.]|nr:hypothetical protein [Haliscomenobacter sp.]
MVGRLVDGPPCRTSVMNQWQFGHYGQPDKPGFQRQPWARSGSSLGSLPAYAAPMVNPMAAISSSAWWIILPGYPYISAKWWVVDVAGVIGYIEHTSIPAEEIPKLSASVAVHDDQFSSVAMAWVW